MDLKKLYRGAGIFLMLLLSLASCKKAEEETFTPETMSGTVEFDIPFYVQMGETVTLSASGIIDPKNANYKWYVSGVYVDTLTSNVVSIRFPDSIGVFIVSANCYADGYYINSTSQQVTTIDTSWNASITGLKASPQFIVDKRDGRAYRYITAGELDWFCQNLAWGGVPFKASPVTAAYFGHFYTWDEAMDGDVCPEGWSVPTNEDWESLAEVLSGGIAVPFVDNWFGLGEKASAAVCLNDERMWPYSPDNSHTNDIGWNAMPLGYTFAGSKKFEGINEYGCWWSATEKNDTQAYYRYIWYDLGDFPMAYTGKSDMRANVRCVRMHPQSL